MGVGTKFNQKTNLAKAKSSALTAALLSNIRAEVAHWLGKAYVCILDDYDKFFDTLNTKVLLDESIAVDFPPDVLCLALQTCTHTHILYMPGGFA